MKPKTKTITFILLSFLLGIICGWFLEDRMLNRMPFTSGGSHGEFIKILNERLHLNEHQIAQVDSILELRKQKMEIFRKEVLAMRDTTIIEIRKILDIEQIKLYDEFNHEMSIKESKRWEHKPEKK
jgi:hypothetical protein